VIKLKLGVSEGEISEGGQTELYSPMMSTSKLSRNGSKDSLGDSPTNGPKKIESTQSISLQEDSPVKIGESSTTSEEIEAFLLKSTPPSLLFSSFFSFF
jgi:hypothetical protein